MSDTPTPEELDRKSYEELPEESVERLRSLAGRVPTLASLVEQASWGPNMSAEMHLAARILTSAGIPALLDQMQRLKEENEELWDAVDSLWGELPVVVVGNVAEERPDLAELARHAHHRMSHEERMVRSQASLRSWWSKQDRLTEAEEALQYVAGADLDDPRDVRTRVFFLKEFVRARAYFAAKQEDTT